MTKKKKKSVRYVFALSGVNIDRIDQKYGIGFDPIIDDNIIPPNATKIDDLDIENRTPDVVSFLDESKRSRKCLISMIDFKSHNKLQHDKVYKCYWDRNFIPESIQPIGCPIKYNSDRATKTYYSEISRGQYSISEEVTDQKVDELKHRKDPRISIKCHNYYETYGVFCSFNCCMAFIHSNKSKSMFRHSETLLIKMYNDMYSCNDVKEILNAPHWETLKEHGGHLTIDKYRKSFNKVEYTSHGIVRCQSLGKIYEENLKLT